MCGGGLLGCGGWGGLGSRLSLRAGEFSNCVRIGFNPYFYDLRAIQCAREPLEL